jgi:hypothetical protein
MRGMKQRRSGPIIAVVAAIPLLLLVAYMGAYYALVTRRLDHGDFWQPEYFVSYRLSWERTESIFALAHRLDRMIRPAYWESPGTYEEARQEMGL